MRLPDRLVLPPRQRDHPYDGAPIGQPSVSGAWDPDAPEAEPTPVRERLIYPSADYLCLDCPLDHCNPWDRGCPRRVENRGSAEIRRSVEEQVSPRTRLLVAIRDLSSTCEKVSGSALARYLQRSRAAIYRVLSPAIADGLVVRHGHRLALTDAGRAAVAGVGSEQRETATGKARRARPVEPVSGERSRIRISSVL